MADKKKFKDTTVGKLLFGAATVVSPQLGSILNGVTSPKDAIAEITKAKIPTEDKIKLQTLFMSNKIKKWKKLVQDGKLMQLVIVGLVRMFVLLFLFGVLWCLVLLVYWIQLIQYLLT
jgi:hypothetical protein